METHVGLDEKDLAYAAGIIDGEGESCKLKSHIV